MGALPGENGKKLQKVGNKRKNNSKIRDRMKVTRK